MFDADDEHAFTLGFLRDCLHPTKRHTGPFGQGLS